MATVLTLPAHVQLLLLAARRQPVADAHRPASAEESERIRSFASESLDWKAFLAVADHHRIAPLVFDTLSRVKPTAMPEFVLETLHGIATRNAFLAVRTVREIDQIARSFAQAGFDLSVLKGVPLSQMLFGSPNLRHIGDIDLITAPQHLPEKLELLAHFGYQRINPRVRLTRQRLATYTEFRKDFTCRNVDSGFDIDLHWRLFDNRQHRGNRILSSAEYAPVKVYGVEARTFALLDQFLYVASHGVSDAWMYFKSLADVAASLRVLTEQELERALTKARELGLLQQISAAIHFANEWFAAGIESPQLLSADDALVRYVRKRMLQLQLRHGFQPNRTHLSTTDWLQLEMQLAPGVQSFREIMGHVIWRPRAWSTVDLPDRLFWIYPLIGMVLPPRRHSLDY